MDANDNTPTFANVSYNVNLFTDMIPGETVLQVCTAKHTHTVYLQQLIVCHILIKSHMDDEFIFSPPSWQQLTRMQDPTVRSPTGS